MFYTIHGFYQNAAHELGLDNDDLLLLRWFVNFKDSGNMRYLTINREKYYWVNYKRLTEELPILGLKKDSIYRKLKRMSELRVLKRKTVYDGGKFSYYTIDKNYARLITSSSTDPDYPDEEPTAQRQPDFYPITTEINPNLVDSNPIPNASNPNLTDFNPIPNASNLNLTDFNPIPNASSPNLTDFNPIPNASSLNLADFNPISNASSPNLTDFNPDYADYISNHMDFNPNSTDSTPNLMDFNPNSTDFAPNLMDFNPDNSDSYPDDADLNPEQIINKLHLNTTLEKYSTTNQYMLSQLLLTLIKKNNPNFKTPDMTLWNKQFGIILNVDKRDPREVEAVIRWVHLEEPFWASQILCPHTLRKHYDKLVAQKNYAKNKFAPKPADSNIITGIFGTYDLSEFEEI